jgi:uncharacterized protein
LFNGIIHKKIGTEPIMLFGSIDPQFTIAGFFVGALVGATGIGGGSLLTPILIVLFGVSPATAVGTDLLFAAATKTVGSMVHGFNRTIEWSIVRRLATGSIPATALALAALSWLDLRSGAASQLLTSFLSIMLLLTAVALIFRNKISGLYAPRLAKLDEGAIARLTVTMGALLGALVTFSSVGAGALGVSALVLLYPRVVAVRIVGSDIAHAVPLTLIAGLGYGIMGSVDFYTLTALLVGSFPGIFLGSLLSARVPDVALRYLLAAVLIVVGSKFAFDISTHQRTGGAGCESAANEGHARNALHNAVPTDNSDRSTHGRVGC